MRSQGLFEGRIWELTLARYKGNKIIDNAFVSGPGYVTEAIVDIAQKYRPDGYCIKSLST